MEMAALFVKWIDVAHWKEDAPIGFKILQSVSNMDYDGSFLKDNIRESNISLL
jgi:hypothetical protein